MSSVKSCGNEPRHFLCYYFAENEQCTQTLDRLSCRQCLTCKCQQRKKLKCVLEIDMFDIPDFMNVPILTFSLGDLTCYPNVTLILRPNSAPVAKQ